MDIAPIQKILVWHVSLVIQAIYHYNDGTIPKVFQAWLMIMKKY